METAQQILDKALTPNLNVELRGSQFLLSYGQVAAMIFLVFLLVLTLARLRHMYVNWSLGKSAIAMLFWGALLTLTLEGLLILGGRTLFTETLGWEKVPQPLLNALDSGRSTLVDVLGVTEEVPESVAGENPNYQNVITDFQRLSPDETEKVRSLICAP